MDGRRVLPESVSGNHESCVFARMLITHVAYIEKLKCFNVDHGRQSTSNTPKEMINDFRWSLNFNRFCGFCYLHVVGEGDDEIRLKLLGFNEPLAMEMKTLLKPRFGYRTHHLENSWADQLGRKSVNCGLVPINKSRRKKISIKLWRDE